MRRTCVASRCLAALIALIGLTASAACTAHGEADPKAEAPPPAAVTHESDSVFRVDHPEQFALVAATSHEGRSTLNVTGVVSPDISRAVPVVSLASGRVVDLRVRLGDHVTQGQLLMRIRSADVSDAESDYRKAQTDANLAQSQLQRAKDLYERGAVAKKDLDVAQTAADDAQSDLEGSTARLRVLGVASGDEPTGVVDVTAPASGVITEQNVTDAAGVKTLDNSPNLFTISDLSQVWILCDVYENDLRLIHEGDRADIHLAAYPDRTLTGRISNIGAVLDPTIRTAKVRIEVANPGLLLVGMFATATFYGPTVETQTVVPATAILHLHDRDWVYVPTTGGAFTRQAVDAGAMLPGNMQILNTGLQPGQRVIADALVFQSTAEQ